MTIRVIDGPAPGAQPQVGVGQDIWRSLAGGVAQGAQAQAGMIGDALGITQTGVDALTRWLAERGVNAPHVDVRQALARMAPLPTQVVPLVAGAVARTAGVHPGAARLVAATQPGGMTYAPTTAQLAADAPAAQWKPQTVWGERAQTLGNWSTAALAPGSIPARAVRVAIPAAISQAAGEITRDTPLEPWARMGGGILGSMWAGGMFNQPGYQQKLAEASRGATDEQIAGAQQRMQTALAQGQPITMAEALQQETGGVTGMGLMQQAIEGTPQGREALGPMMARRPDQARQGIVSLGQAVLPDQTPPPSLMGRNAQNAAEAAIGQTRRGINEATSGLYTALEGQTLPPDQYAQLAGGQAFQQALSQVRGDPVLNEGLAHLPDNSMAVINKVEQHLRTLADNAAPAPNKPFGNASLSAAYGAAADRVRAAAEAGSDAYGAARTTQAQLRGTQLDPLTLGPEGKIARTPDVGRQLTALFPNQPVSGQAAETARAIRGMEAASPGAGAALVGEHLIRTGNEGTQANLGGVNQWGGGKWAAQVAGNPEQEATLLSGYGAAGGDTGELQSFLETMRAQGRRLNVGSPTVEKAVERASLGQVVDLLSDPKSILNVIGRMEDKYRNWQAGRNATALANAITADPAQAAQIVLRARSASAQQGLSPLARLAMAVQLSRAPQAALPPPPTP